MWARKSSDSEFHFNNGANPDSYPSFDVNPIWATDTMTHAFMSIGDSNITLEVSDDDCGFSMLTLDITI